ncbi:hypothetical protein MHY_11960 [Megamonas hypermegale ART12/1]|nr:hypothetical protein MHY_11960 [Megamonas hypermegale ART12/1]
MIYRKATFNDVEEIYNLVNLYAQEGVMLARSRNTLYETLRDMYVAEEDGEILGVGGLHIVWDELAEVRTLAVAKKLYVVILVQISWNISLKKEKL